MAQNASAPSKQRKHPETRWWTFTMRKHRSARLEVNHTARLEQKRRISFFSSLKASARFQDSRSALVRSSLPSSHGSGLARTAWVTMAS